MKNLTLFVTLLFSVVLSAQFPGTKTELLLNKELKVLDKNSPKEYGYPDFYKDKALDKVYACCQRYNTKYEKLVNRVFKVTAIEPVKGIKNRGGTMFLLTLEDGKETVYFKYNSQYESTFPFEVIGGLELPADFYCSRIKAEKSQLQAGNIFYVSDGAEGFIFYKMNTNDITTYMVSMTMPSDTPKPVTKGASILLENGYLIDWPNVEVKAVDNGYGGEAYKAHFALTSAEVEMLKTHKIVKKSVNGIEEKVERGESHRGVFNCLFKLPLQN